MWNCGRPNIEGSFIPPSRVRQWDENVLLSLKQNTPICAQSTYFLDDLLASTFTLNLT
jgi:hypothetical protein